MNNIVFGKYIPTNSIIHKLDPRIKIISLIILLVAVFVPDSWYYYLFLLIIVLSRDCLSIVFFTSEFVER